MWCIGDDFLFHAYPILQRLCTEAKANHEQVPYLHDLYNVDSYFQGQLSLLKPTAVHFVNSLLDGLNIKNWPHLPKYILVFPDKDIISELKNEEFGVKKFIKTELQWIITQFNRQLESRHEVLKPRKTRIHNIRSPSNRLVQDDSKTCFYFPRLTEDPQTLKEIQ